MPNRLIVTAMATQYCDELGNATERYAAYHEARARGGWGLVISEDTAVSRDGRSTSHNPGLWDDSQVASHRRAVERVHEAGGRIGAQLFHAGRYAPRAVNGVTPVAPTALAAFGVADVPRILSPEEIANIVDDFAQAARRAVDAGFDLVEIHGAHGYLVHSFMSPYSNKRVDEYGGTIAGRARFALEVVRAVRETIGPEMPLSFRLSVNDHVPGGLSVADARVYARLLEEAGVDLLDCSQGVPLTKECIIPPSSVPHGAFLADTRAIREVVGIPVVAVGRLNDPYVAEHALVAGDADFVAMARASLADPDLPRKLSEGREDEIVHCIGCCRGCTGQNVRGLSVGCMVNPLVGHEWEVSSNKAVAPLDVMVVGGGVSGLMAALAAARRGHRVTIYEKTDLVGGQWLIAAVPPGKDDYTTFLEWLVQELEALGVTTVTGIRLSAEDIVRLAPDKVIVATGSIPLWLSRLGLDDTPGVYEARDVLSGKAAPQGRVAVLGGGLVGAELAATLVSQGHEVEIFEMRSGIALDAEASPRKVLLDELRAASVRLWVGNPVDSVAKGEVRMAVGDQIDVHSGFDSIVVAMGAQSESEITNDLPVGVDYVVVGDAASVKDGFLNIAEAYAAGSTL